MGEGIQVGIEALKSKMMEFFNFNLKELIEKFKIPIALSLVGLVLIIGGIVSSGLNKPKQSFPKESLVSGEKFVTVDVSGAVKTPGVYKLKDGSRIEEAVAAAGGLAEDVNQEYIAKYLNMAQKLSDGTKVYVPIEGDSVPAGAGQGSVAGANTSSKVNINTSSQAELEALSGVGPATANKIIGGRPYGAVDDLLNKKIIGKSLFDKIKDSLVLY